MNRSRKERGSIVNTEKFSLIGVAVEIIGKIL